MSATSDILDHAADILEEGGWMQGFAEDPIGRHCVWGAIEKASHGDVGPRVLAVEALCRCIGPCPLAIWNDADERTADEVISTLRKVALASSEPVP